jgi:hypothetical protein
MVSVTVVVWVVPPPFAVTVMVCFPTLAFLPALTVMVDAPDPGAAIELGLKVTVWALPCPEADKVITELKLPETVAVICDVPDAFLATVMEPGEAEMEKPAAIAEVTVSDTDVV